MLVIIQRKTLGFGVPKTEDFRHESIAAGKQALLSMETKHSFKVDSNIKGVECVYLLLVFKSNQKSQ